MKQIVALVLAAFACALVSSASFAEEKSKASAPAEADVMKQYMEASAPGPHHAAFKSLVGQWTATIKLWNAPGGEPTSSTGKSTYALAFGDRFLTQKFDGEIMAMPFSGMGVSGYDKTKNKHTTYWIDSMGTQAVYAEGDCSDNCMKETYVFSIADAVSLVETKVKMVTTIKSKDEHVMEWYMLGADGSAQKTMEIVYTRIGS